MKKILVFLIIMVITTTCFAGATQYNLGSKGTPISSDWWSSGRLSDTGTNWAREIDALVALSSNPGTGKVWYIDKDVVNEGDGSSWLNATDTLNEAIVLSEADGGDNRGDHFLMAQGHDETFTMSAGDDVDVTVDGAIIRGVGEGTDAPEFTFTDVNNEIVIGAANITLINVRLIAGVSSIVAAVHVEDAGDYFTLARCDFPKPTTNSFEFLDSINVASGVTHIRVVGCYAQNDDAGAAPSHFIDLGNAALVGVHIENNIIFGDFAVAAIWSDDADTEVYVVNNIVTNMTSTQHGIEFAGNATGVLRNNLVSTDAIGTSYDPGRLADSGNFWDDSGTYDTTAVPWATNETGVNRWGATELAQIEGEATDAIEAWGSEQCVTKSLTSIVNGNNDLFVVAGGPIKIIELFGIVTTTAIEGKSALINYNMDPTIPAGDTVFGTDGTALEINGDTVGALYTWDGVIANDLTATDNGVALGMPAPTLIVPAGSLELAVVVATSATGQIDFFLRYKPMVPGAIVTAAP